MSSISKAPLSNNMPSESSEESGWTKYFEDFFNDYHNIHDQKCSISFSGGVDDCSSSFVSDAASLAAAKNLAYNAQAGEEYRKRSSYRKRKKIKTTLVDDDLEDTASSPIHSPKVLYENQLHKTKEKEEKDLYQQEKGNTSGGTDKGKELGFNERDSDCTELKKKGLCLVPLSVVMNYLG